MHSLAHGIGEDALLHILARGIGMIPDDMEIKSSGEEQETEDFPEEVD